MNDSRARLARELLASLQSDRQEAERWTRVRSRLDATDAFDREEGRQAGGYMAKDSLRQLPKGGTRVAARGDETQMNSHQKRDNKRFTTPVLRVMVASKSYETIDWSLGGFMLKEYDGEAKVNLRLSVTFAHSQPGSPYFPANVRVVRVDLRKRTLSLKFEKLGGGGFDFLSGLQLQQLKQHRR